MEFKAQSAIEYLMTYGWMLLAVSVVSGAIFATINTSPVNNISGLSNTDVQVDEFGLSEKNGLQISFRNINSDQIEITNLSVSDPETGNEAIISPSKPLAVGRSQVFSFFPVVSSDQENILKLNMTYSLGNLKDLVATGQINGNLKILPIQQGMLGYWRLDRQNPVDSSGGFDGAKIGNVTADVAGRVNRSYRFDGNDSYVEIEDDGSLNPKDKMSVHTWVKQEGGNNNSDGNSQLIMEKYYWGSWGLLQWGGIGNSVTWHLEFQDGRDADVSTDDALTDDGKWHNIVGTYDGRVMKIYFDGEFQDSIEVSGDIAQGGGDVWLGRHGNSPHHFWFNGKIDDVRIYNRSLSEEEVERLYKNGN